MYKKSTGKLYEFRSTLRNLLWRYGKDCLGVLALLLFSFLGICFFFNLSEIDLSIPLSYSGGDDLGAIVNAKVIAETGGTMVNNALGAPFGSDGYDFTANLMHHFDNLLLTLFIWVFKDPVLSLNLFYFSLFPLIGLISYFVMRELKIRSIYAFLGSLTFEFMPYIFMRGVGHIVLSAYQFVPLAILICVWAFGEEDFLVFNRRFFFHRKNWIALIACLLIANNGIAYYAFFTCFFLCVTALSKLLKEKRLTAVFKPLFLVVVIGGFTAVNAVPAVLYNARNGPNEFAVVRNVAESEIYGLKIAQLFIPVNNHGVTFLKDIITDYNTKMPLVNENNTSYLGLFGILGFVSLLLLLIAGRKGETSESRSRLLLLSELNIFGVLFGTIGGFSALFAVVISEMIRGYNRISIFIGYICILGLMLLLEEIKFKRLNLKIAYAAATFVCFAGIWEQAPHRITLNHAAVAEAYKSDEAFVRNIEALLPENSMVFQLPYHKYPEGGFVNGMADYHLFVGYIHSDSLRWSYGAVKGREGDAWFERVNGYALPDMLRTVSLAGYSGLYIDRRAYPEDMLKALEAQVTAELGETPIYSQNSTLAFFNMKEYNENLEKNYSEEDYEAERKRVFEMN